TTAAEIVTEAMRAMLLRHAKSKKAQGGMRDHARRLKGRGKSDAPVIGAYMARHELVPDLVLVSTAERARQTRERLATARPAPPRRLQGSPLQRWRRCHRRAGERNGANGTDTAPSRAQSGAARRRSTPDRLRRHRDPGAARRGAADLWSRRDQLC